MALAKRIIPCLDVDRGRVVKGVNFVGLRDAGNPVEIARRYNEQGADELTFLDITASSDERDLILPIVESVAAEVFIPLTVGGGVRKVEDVRRLLNAGGERPVWTRSSGRVKCRSWVPEKFCSRAWTATARARASICRSRAPSPTRWTCRSSRAAG